MPVTNTTTTKPTQSRSSPTPLIENHDNENCQPNVAFLPQQQHHHQNRHLKKPNKMTSKTASPSSSFVDQTPARLLEIKQQRSEAAANRKKRLITRIISIVGILIILLCAAIVTLTLKMAPKIDELVRTKTGPHPSIHLKPRISTPSTTPTNDLYNLSTNSSSK